MDNVGRFEARRIPGSSLLLSDRWSAEGSRRSRFQREEGATCRAECTLVEPKGIVGECRVQIFLHGGLVTVEGPIHFGVNDRSRGAVTGGAGRFRNARGQVIFVNSTGQTQGFILQLEP